MMLSFGQPLGAICQIAYFVPDLKSAIPAYARSLNAGPWLMIEHFEPVEQTYRGAPTNVDLSIATAYSGSMMIELIQQHNDVPSVYTEVRDMRGYGFHHFAVTTKDFEADVAKYGAQGYATAFEAVAPAMMDNARVAYFDALPQLPGMIELIEMNDKLEAFFAATKAPCVDWDGVEMIRTL